MSLQVDRQIKGAGQNLGANMSGVLHTCKDCKHMGRKFFTNKWGNTLCLCGKEKERVDEYLKLHPGTDFFDLLRITFDAYAERKACNFFDFLARGADMPEKGGE